VTIPRLRDDEYWKSLEADEICAIELLQQRRLVGGESMSKGCLTARTLLHSVSETLLRA
jgi:hypothetical protein